MPYAPEPSGGASPHPPPDPGVAGFLGRALSLEMSAVQQFLANARLLASWGLEPEAARFRAEAQGELEHVERIMARMIALGLAPNVSVLRPVRTGADPAALYAIAADLERQLVAFYGAAARHCASISDGAGRVFFETLLAEEAAHAEGFEANPSTQHRPSAP